MGRKRIGNLVKGAEGSIAAITAICLVVLLGVASLAIDMGQLYTVRNELQNTADASALAAAAGLINDSGGVAVRDASAAQQAALNLAQRQAQLQGLTSVADGSRNDLTIIFGQWNLGASPDSAWTEIGSTCGANSNANAVRITLRRASGVAYGPVTSLLGWIFGDSCNASEVSATATAYLGYTDSTPPGAVNVPLALPDTILQMADGSSSSWWARLCAPAVANASTPQQMTFKDLGSGTFYQSNLQKPQFDAAKAYMVIVKSSDPVPDTVINNLKKNYTSGTVVRSMNRGTRLYPLSEYQWASNIKSIFLAFQGAYNAKKNSSGKWRVTVPVYSTSDPVASRLKEGLFSLARLISPWPSKAWACFEFWNQSYPGGNVPIYVSGFANVDITNVTYNANCDDCSRYSPAKDGKRYSSQLDCMVNSSGSARNANSITVEVPVDSSTVSPTGTESGGVSNQGINSGAPANVGAFASIPKLVK